MMKKLKALIDRFANIQLVDLNKSQNQVHDPTTTILFSDCWPDGKILEMAAEGNFTTFLNSNNRNFESELLTALKVMDDPKGFLTNPLPCLFNETPNTLTIPFTKKEDKPTIIAKMDSFLNQTGSRIVQEHARILFEELFMNAVFDAPAEAKKLGLNSKKQRCEFNFAFDGEKLAISCFDGYGSLNPLKIAERMRDIHNHGTKNIINLGQRKGGAGIGCSLLHHYSSSMIIAVERGVGTRVTCFIPLKISQKNFYNLGKNLQIINLDESGGKHGK